MKFCANSGCGVTDTRKFFTRLLWRAFPSPSENALAEIAAPVLNVSERQVRNWLREEHTPRADHFLKVMAIAGAEIAFEQVEGQR